MSDWREASWGIFLSHILVPHFSVILLLVFLRVLRGFPWKLLRLAQSSSLKIPPLPRSKTIVETWIVKNVLNVLKERSFGHISMPVYQELSSTLRLDSTQYLPVGDEYGHDTPNPGRHLGLGGRQEELSAVDAEVVALRVPVLTY